GALLGFAESLGAPAEATPAITTKLSAASTALLGFIVVFSFCFGLPLNRTLVRFTHETEQRKQQRQSYFSYFLQISLEDLPDFPQDISPGLHRSTGMVAEVFQTLGHRLGVVSM